MTCRLGSAWLMGAKDQVFQEGWSELRRSGQVKEGWGAPPVITELSAYCLPGTYQKAAQVLAFRELIF